MELVKIELSGKGWEKISLLLIMEMKKVGQKTEELNLR